MKTDFHFSLVHIKNTWSGGVEEYEEERMQMSNLCFLIFFVFGFRFVIQGTGECAYLTDSGVSSGKRYVIRKRICSKTNSNVSISLNTSRPF